MFFHQIVQVAYPISTYTYLGTLPVVFLVTDFLRYKPVILLEGVAFVITYCLLIWGDGLTNLKVIGSKTSHIADSLCVSSTVIF
jgi:thiamine transporter 2/3